MAKAKVSYYGTGKRKTSIAKVTLTEGKGKVTVNGVDVHEYFPFETKVMDLTQPLELTEMTDKFDVSIEYPNNGPKYKYDVKTVSNNLGGPALSLFSTASMSALSLNKNLARVFIAEPW